MKAKLLANKQQGAVTLLTALVLLISITLISLLTAKTVLVETQITADNYRTSQATAAASAAMDQAVAYFSDGGLDHDANDEPDFIVGAEPSANSCVPPSSTEGQITLTTGAQTTLAQYYFDNRDDNDCDDSPLATLCESKDADVDGDCFGITTSPGGYGTNMTRALVTAKGWSDDCTAVRTITQCVGTYKIFRGGGGPQQPFVSKAGVGVFGNAKLINRYNNSSIWSGGADAVHGASYGTYLRPSGTEVADYTSEQLDSEDEDDNTQLVSDRNTGNGIDVVTGDPTLGSKTTSTTNLTDPAQNQFFDMFFAHTKAEIKNAAASTNQLLTAGTSPVGKTGLIWVEGNTALHSGDVVGSPIQPAILIVNGDLDLTGGPIYGVIYVTGELKIAGNPVVKGSIVSENGPNSGAGTLTLVYKPWGEDSNQAPPFINGTGTVIAGSWKDW